MFCVRNHCPKRIREIEFICLKAMIENLSVTNIEFTFCVIEWMILFLHPINTFLSSHLCMVYFDVDWAVN